MRVGIIPDCVILSEAALQAERWISRVSQPLPGFRITSAIANVEVI